MLSTGEKLRLASLVLFLLALLCVPLPAMSPKAALSAFSTLKVTGWFIYLGFGALAAAVLLFAASFLFRR
jgi:hypothetical protein